MGLGIVPVIQQAVMTLPWPAGVRSLMLHPAGPFTSIITILLNNFYFSFLLGTNIQVANYHSEHWRFQETS